MGQISWRHGLLWGWCLALIVPADAYALSGQVFRDGNGNGIRDSGERGVPGITVKAFINGTPETLAGTVTSGADGSYSISGVSGPVRVEFEIPAAGCNADSAVDFSAPNAQQYGSSVQFVDGAATNVDFGVLNAAEYVVSPNPTMFTSFLYGGNVKSGTISGNAPALYSYAYQNSGRAASLRSIARWPGETPAPGTAPDPVVLLKQQQVGTTWGGAYSKQAKRLFVSAFLRRHAGMGPDGSGAVYMLNPDAPPTGTPSFFNLDALGFATRGSGTYTATHPGFSAVIGTNSNRGLADAPNTPTHDAAAFGQVGKVSLGDLDLSDDGRYLFVTNLYDRKLYRIDLQNPTAPVVPGAAQVKAYSNAPWLGLSCSSGVARPFGLKYYRGKIYTGVVCTGESGTASANKTRAYVYAVDPESDGSSASIAVEFPLNYDKQDVDSNAAKGWFNWTDNFTSFAYLPSGGGLTANPQPMLSDIEFDSDGSMILAFADRTGFQLGYDNYAPTSTNTKLYSGLVGGDILRVYKNPTSCTYQLESNGQAGNLTSASRTYAQDIADYGVFLHPGPGTPNGAGSAFTSYTDSGNKRREFYFGDYAELNGNRYPRETHGEGIFGALALWPSSGEVIATGMDPVADYPGSGGTYKLSNTTGARNSGYNLYDDTDAATYLLRDQYGYASEVSTMAKSAGLGDIEITGDIPDIEIGNRIWLDTDKDGIQDGDENGIDGVEVHLICGADTATTTTVNGGQYYFTNAAGGNATFMDSGESCVVQVDNAQPAIGNRKLSPQNADGITDNNPVTDLRDSDAADKAGKAEITFTVGNAGENNHTLDIGYERSADISLVKTVDKANAKRAENVVYTLVVTNNGPDATTGVQVTDALPAGVTYVSDDGGGAYNATSGVWDIGDLPNGESRTLNITVKLN